MTHAWIQMQTSAGVARVGLNRAPANAYQTELLQAINHCLTQLEADTSIRVVIIHSALPKFFCAGADIAVFQANSVEQNLALVAQARANAALIEQSHKIYLAEIAGHCLGGGLELAMACDRIFAGQGQYLLGLPEIKLGLIPGNGGSQRLVRRVGLANAMKLLATGDNVNVEAAHRMGLIDETIPAELLTESVNGFAEKVAANSGTALAATKRALREGAFLPLAEALTLEATLADSLYETQDAREGLTAFVEKRSPQFNQHKNN
ncbi:enoyl-CoA hydratase/isomerase family protein [Simiduia agarivorans]|uniref:Enoyl-CoA hydratase/isomerase n=1 Tax=Simiduia agarivorans (strain DSM 21679 / JCM 13881 / BCRC 17597 / SA1) TaxID=1117647 RepID=K4KQU6_SIMAS|nr:enoyl-CoA hydratase-related protein [Simiduia agarivorans]AFV00499.1 Enoyl-CoA hydratase/isomerase [Simiduia agarivorans SA1 = DSM 21679]